MGVTFVVYGFGVKGLMIRALRFGRLVHAQRAEGLRSFGDMGL